MLKLRINQPTPCGGAYSELIYLEDPTKCQKSSDIMVVIQEYDASGNMLQETVGHYANSSMGV